MVKKLLTVWQKHHTAHNYNTDFRTRAAQAEYHAVHSGMIMPPQAEVAGMPFKRNFQLRPNGEFTGSSYPLSPEHWKPWFRRRGNRFDIVASLHHAVKPASASLTGQGLDNMMQRYDLVIKRFRAGFQCPEWQFPILRNNGFHSSGMTVFSARNTQWRESC